MKFKRWAAGIAALLLILSMGLISCAKPAGGTPEDNPVPQEEEEEEEIVSYKFGFSCISMENPYYETLEASIREAIEESGSTLISRDPKGDSTAQIQQIRDMIADGIQAIFLCPVDWEKIAPALTELKEADIEIINLDTQVQDREEVDAYVGSDNINAGVICGEKLIEAAPDGGQVVILECTTQNSIIDRINGFEETIAGKGFEVVERSETGEERRGQNADGPDPQRAGSHYSRHVRQRSDCSRCAGGHRRGRQKRDDDLQRGWFSQTQTGACQGWQPCCGDRGTVSN